MLLERRRLLRQGVALADLAMLIASVAIAYAIVVFSFHRRFPAISVNDWPLALIAPIWLVCLRGAGLYRSDNYVHPVKVTGRLLQAQVLAALLLLSAMYLTRSETISRLLIQCFLLVSCLLLTVQKLALTGFLIRTRRRTPGHRRRVVLVAEPLRAARCVEQMRSRVSMLADIVAILKPVSVPDGGGDGTFAEPLEFRGTVDDLPALVGSELVDEVMVVLPVDKAILERLCEWCAVRGILIRLWMEVRSPSIGVWTADYLNEGAFLLSLATVPQGPLNLALKRAVDLASAAIGLIACGAAYVWYGARLKRETGGSVLFHQQRVGRNGRSFVLYKFRTMGVDAEQQKSALSRLNQMDGPMFKIEHDPRVTPTGRKLRRRHLDELPQFWNVLRGEMSMVGTRPPTRDETAVYRNHHYRRLSMKPGITGLWQLSGNRAVKGFEEVVRLDCQYIDHWSLWLDLKILAKTVGKVMRGDGW